MINPLIPKKNTSSKGIDVPHSAGILDDFAVRKVINTREGTIEKVPVNNSDIANKAYVDSKDYWVLNGTSIYYNSGKVGIGIDTPSNKLHIYDDAADPWITIATGRHVAGEIFTVNEGDCAVFNSWGAFSFNGVNGIEFKIGWGLVCKIDSSGNLGIGTDTPTAKLQVVGLVDYANNAAAVAAGLTAGAFYTETGTNPKRVCVVY